DTVGAVLNGWWYLRNSNTSGSADAWFQYGNPGDSPVPGDWNADGVDTAGQELNGSWYLRNTNTPGSADLVVTAYRKPPDTPVVGDWDGDGHDSLGQYLGETFYLTNRQDASAGAEIVRTLPGAGLPVAGDVLGLGRDAIARYQSIGPSGFWQIRPKL